MLRITIRSFNCLQSTAQLGFRRNLTNPLQRAVNHNLAMEKPYSTLGFGNHGKREMWKTSCVSWTGPPKTIAVIATTTSVLTANLWTKRPLQCQAVYTDISDVNAYQTTDLKDAQPSKALIHKGELSFGVILGFCTGFLVKKVGKFFALMVGVAFLFMQYLSSKGYVSVNWDRMEKQYSRQIGVGEDGKGTTQAVYSKWNEFVGFLTSNLQFKSAFLVGLYGGIRYD